MNCINGTSVLLYEVVGCILFNIFGLANMCLQAGLANMCLQANYVLPAEHHLCMRKREAMLYACCPGNFVCSCTIWTAVCCSHQVQLLPSVYFWLNRRSHL